MIARSPVGLGLVIGIGPRSIKGLMASNILDLRSASFSCFERKESGDSKMFWTVHLTGELVKGSYSKGHTPAALHLGQKDNFWPCARGLRVCQLMMQWNAAFMAHIDHIGLSLADPKVAALL